jgi:asparagine synthase (glutamine-hydrolysing)
MCGIAGLVGERDPERARATVGKMVEALKARGPDGGGLEAFGAAVLGHRRLSIYDLSDAGRQPMLSDDRQLGVVFNGAIYNFLEIRAELERTGARFRSRCDTEVLLHGYRAWGLQPLLQRLRGMFSIGLWDERLQKLFLLRDRLGVKPLVYVEREGRLAFASTARALKVAGLVGEIDPQAVTEYLEYGYVPDERTIYVGAKKLAAGACLEWTAGRSRGFAYWRLPSPEERGTKISFADAVAETERLLVESVRLRLEADVKVGALLSGGVDSSLVCWAIARAGADITAFTVGTPGDPMDESEDARATAQGLKIPHQLLELRADDPPEASELTHAYGEPFACASGLGMLRVSRAVRASATVLLTGDGGDDVFLGYPEHRHFLMAERLARALPSPLSRSWRGVRRLLPERGTVGRAVHFLDYATGGLGAVARVRDGLPFLDARGVLGERLTGTRVPFRDTVPSPASARALVSEYLAHDRRTRFVGEFMTKVDGGTMAYALEARAPFLDQRVWEFAATLPYEVRLSGGKLKAILRALARRHLGDRVADGKKRGFGIPVQRWMVGRWRGAVEGALHDSCLEQEGFIHAAPLRQAFAEAVTANWAPVQLWHLYVLELWLRHERATS